MRTLIAGWLLFVQAVLAAGASNTVVNLSHYDMVNADFARMRDEGVIGVIHESSYPRFERDAKYAYRQNAALRAGLLWGAYHFADGTDPVRQADHFLNTVASAWRATGAPEGR